MLVIHTSAAASEGTTEFTARPTRRRRCAKSVRAARQATLDPTDRAAARLPVHRISVKAAQSATRKVVL